MPWLVEKKKEERERDDRWSTLPWTFAHGIRSRLRRNLSTTERSTSINLLLRLLPFSDVHPWFPSPLQLSRLLPRISFLPVLSKWFQLCLSLSLSETLGRWFLGLPRCFLSESLRLQLEVSISLQPGKDAPQELQARKMVGIRPTQLSLSLWVLALYHRRAHFGLPPFAYSFCT